jgi:hypothetical protein
MGGYIKGRREYINILTEMLTSVLRALVKKINIEIMYWKLMKGKIFNFMKVKSCCF